MRNGLGGWLLTGAVVGVVGAFVLAERANALTIYPTPGGMTQWHLSIPISVPSNPVGPAIPGGGILATTNNSNDHRIYDVLNPNQPPFNQDLTITDVTYDFCDLDLGLDSASRAAASVQVTLRAGVHGGPATLNPTTVGSWFNTFQYPNANVYFSAVGHPTSMTQQYQVLDSSSFFLFRDLFFDGALSGSAGTAITSDGLVLDPTPGAVSPLSPGGNCLDFSSRGLATDCHNFQTGLFVPTTHSLYASVRVHAPGVAGAGPSPVVNLSMGNVTGWVWLHLQGRYR